MSADIIVEIVNKKGLHARAAAKFVKIVAEFGVAVTVVKLSHEGEGDSPPVAGASILGLMMLGADPGSRLQITADSEPVTQALKELIENRFGESE